MAKILVHATHGPESRRLRIRSCWPALHGDRSESVDAALTEAAKSLGRSLPGAKDGSHT